MEGTPLIETLMIIMLEDFAGSDSRRVARLSNLPVTVIPMLPPEGRPMVPVAALEM